MLLPISPTVIIVAAGVIQKHSNHTAQSQAFSAPPSQRFLKWARQPPSPQQPFIIAPSCQPPKQQLFNPTFPPLSNPLPFSPLHPTLPQQLFHQGYQRFPIHPSSPETPTPKGPRWYILPSPQFAGRLYHPRTFGFRASNKSRQKTALQGPHLSTNQQRKQIEA